MRTLILGGNRFLGIDLVARLLARGHQLTLLNRGTLEDPFTDRVARLRVDRDTDAFDAALADTTWDAVVDLSLFNKQQAERTARVLKGRVGHYVMISTGQVYLVREGMSLPASESAYDGPLIARPDDPAEGEEWDYGAFKRDAETVIAQNFDATRLRLPMVHGARDHRRRLDSILFRLLDRRPITLTRPDAVVKHVFAPAVSRTITRLLAGGATKRAYNLAMPETLTVRDFVARIASCLDTTAHLTTASPDAFLRHQLNPLLACPFNTPWMSALDASAATSDGLLDHEPLEVWLPAVVHGLMGRWSSPPAAVSQPDLPTDD